MEKREIARGGVYGRVWKMSVYQTPQTPWLTAQLRFVGANANAVVNPHQKSKQTCPVLKNVPQSHAFSTPCGAAGTRWKRIAKNRMPPLEVPAHSVDKRGTVRMGFGPMRSPGAGAIGVLPVLVLVQRAARNFLSCRSRTAIAERGYAVSHSQQ